MYNNGMMVLTSRRYEAELYVICLPQKLKNYDFYIAADTTKLLPIDRPLKTGKHSTLLVYNSANCKSN